MNSAPSFAQILAEYLENQSEAPSATPVENQSFAHGVGAARGENLILELMTRLNSTYFRGKTDDEIKKSPYRSLVKPRHKTQSRAHETPMETRKAERNIALSRLSASSQIAALLLGIEGDFTISTLKRAYRKLARESHPDANPNASPERFRSIHAAYSGLLAEIRIIANDDT